MCKLAMESWAFIRSDTPISSTVVNKGQPSILADSTFDSEESAWIVGLGWPSEEEIKEAKRKGYRVAKVRIEEL